MGTALNPLRSLLHGRKYTFFDKNKNIKTGMWGLY